MRFEGIDLNLFVVFDAIYREGNITRVASHLKLSQPAVSNALSRLRQTFDDPLFVRTSQGMEPTPVADSMVGDIREAIALLRHSVGVTSRFDPANSERVFRLAMNDLAESLVLPRLHALVKAQAPNSSLSSYYVARESATEELKVGLIDILVDVPMARTKALRQQTLAEFPYVVAMRREHPLAGGPVTMKDYLASEHLHVSSRRKGRGHVDIALNQLDKKRAVVMRVQNYLVAARITEETDLLWSVPAALADTLSLTKAELPFEVEPLAWNLYWPRNAEDDPASRWMRTAIQKVVAEVAEISALKS